MKNLGNLLIAFLSFWASGTLAQEFKTDLLNNETLKSEWQQISAYSKSTSPVLQAIAVGDTLLLPFIDDFSKPGIFPDAALWYNTDVYINNSLCVKPVTYGVASFDGVNHRGTPYNTTDPNAYGFADSLLSKNIRLDSILGSAIDSTSGVAISFYYESQGIGNAPESEDSLVLYFKDTAGHWNHAWGMSGSEVGADTNRFTYVQIPITDPAYLFNGFQFMFRNYATLSGFFDVWNLDYVRLDVNRPAGDSLFNDVGFVSSSNTLLNNYYQMPWKHFLYDQSTHKKTYFENDIYNFWNVEKYLSYQYRVYDKTGAELYSSGNLEDNIAAMAHQSYPPQVTPAFNFTFPSESGDSTQFTLVNSISTTFDFNHSNDTIIHKQIFYNYYAHDDGTAESGYGLNTLGGKIAYKFTPVMSDTLRGVFMYFTKYSQDVSLRTFKVTVWDALGPGGSPGNVIYQTDLVNPMYRDWLNTFYFYQLEVPQYIDISFTPSIYIGWEQNTSDILYLGLDLNSNTQDSFYFNTTGIWYPSLIKGSWMMRPAFGAPVPSTINTGFQELTKAEPNIRFYPNPASSWVHFNSNFTSLESGKKIAIRIFDFTGRMVYTTSNYNSIDVTSWSSGMYMICVDSEDGKIHETGKIVVSH